MNREQPVTDKASSSLGNASMDVDNKLMSNQLGLGALMASLDANSLTLLRDFESPDENLRQESIKQVISCINLLDRITKSIVLVKLVERLATDASAALQKSIALVLTKFVNAPYVRAYPLLCILIDLLRNPDDTVRTQLYRTIAVLLKHRQVISDDESTAKVVELQALVIKDADEGDNNIKFECLPLLATLCFVFRRQAQNKKVLLSDSEYQEMISKHTNNNSPGVREAALRSLVDMHLRGAVLDKALYHLAVNALSDEYLEVRLMALDLIRSLTLLYSVDYVPVSSENKVVEASQSRAVSHVRFDEDAFGRVCDLVNDPSLQVRVKAFILLRSYRNVEVTVLEQGFSKQIISRLRVRTPGINAENRSSRVSQFFNVDGDTQATISSDMKVMESGACGAFIHGIEDEFHVVRDAAVDTICEVSLGQSKLIPRAVQCLVDMFNDEILSVRVNAINSLRRLATTMRVVLNHEQMIISLGVLEDANKVVREAMHEALRVVRAKTDDDLVLLLHHLVRDLNRFYDEDHESVVRCVAEFGRTHHKMISEKMSWFLSLDERFLPRESSVSEHLYTVHAVLVANACGADHSMLDKVPPFVFGHFDYYKQKYPECMPDIQTFITIRLQRGMHLPETTKTSKRAIAAAQQAEIDVIGVDLNAAHDATDQFMENAIELANRSMNASKRGSSVQSSIALAKSQFTYTATLNSMHTHVSHLAILYLDCFALAIKYQSELLSASAHGLLLDAGTLMRNAYAMQHSFFGLHADHRHAIMHFRLLANILSCIAWNKDTTPDTNFVGVQARLFYPIAARIERIKEAIPQNTAYYESLEKLDTHIQKYINNPGGNIQGIADFVVDTPPVPIDLTHKVKRLRATITGPMSNLDKPIFYDQVSPLNITVQADVHHASELDNIGVAVSYLGRPLQFHWPISPQFVKINPSYHLLTTTFKLIVPDHIDALPLNLTIVRRYQAEQADVDYTIALPPGPPETPLSNALAGLRSIPEHHTIAVSDPLPIYLKMSTSTI
ncbi:armadillo-type protein [Gongronella butleri]|nr:armadillo-type protein [Gongronella butleri]